jgi:hypothetical protein
MLARGCDGDHNFYLLVQDVFVHLAPHLSAGLRHSRSERRLNVGPDNLQGCARVRNSAGHGVEMMDHMLVADVFYLDASASQCVSVRLPLVAQYVETHACSAMEKDNAPLNTRCRR